jgi:hypothetical protein
MKYKNYRYHHISHITYHTSHVTHHISHITRHTSHVTRHTSSKSFTKSTAKARVSGRVINTQRSNQITHRLEEDIFAMTVKFEC